jgi:hypothetical protein
VVTAVNLNNKITGNKFTWTVTSQKCGSKSQTVTVYNNTPTAKIESLGDNFLNCSTSLSLSANAIEYAANGETGQWTGPGNAAFSNGGTTANTYVSNLPNGNVTLTWTVTRPDGDRNCQSTDQITFENLAFKAKILTNPDALDKCLSTINLSADPIPTGVRGEWTVLNSDLLDGNTTSTTASLHVEDLPAGATTFVWTLYDDTHKGENDKKCDSQPDDIVVYNHQYNGSAGVNQYLCEDYYTMAAEALPTTAEGTWTLVSTDDPNATLTSRDVHNANMYVEHLGEGENKFKWSVKNYFTEDDKTSQTNNFCLSAKEVSVYNMSFVADANANTDSKEINICTEEGQLNGKTYGNDYTLEWTADNAKFDDGTGNYTATTASIANPKFKLDAESSKFFLKVTRTLPGGKTCEKNDDVTVYNRKPAAIVLSNVSTCNGVVDLNGALNNQSTETGYWTKESAMGEFETTDANAHITATSVDVAAVSIKNLPEATSTTVTWTVKSTKVANCETSTPITVTNYGFKPSITGYVPADCAESTAIEGTLPTTSLASDYTGTWTGPSGVHFGDENDGGKNSAKTTVTNLLRGDNNITWTVNHKDYTCPENTVTVTIKNLKAGTAELTSAAEQWVCSKEGETINISAKQPEAGVIGTWTSSMDLSGIDVNSTSFDITPDRGVSTFTWTISREGQTDTKCTDSKTIKIHNNVVVAETDADEFVSCDGNVELRAVDVRNKYGNSAIGWWTSTSASFAETGDPVKTGADNSNVITAYGVTSGETFTWNVKKTDAESTDSDLEHKTCTDSKTVTVKNFYVPAVVTSGTQVYCDNVDNPSAALTAESIEGINGAKGQWTCVIAPTGVNKEEVNALISARASYSTVVTNLPKVGTYEFEWKVWHESGNCAKTAPTHAIVINDSRIAEPIKNYTSEIYRTCDNTFTGLNATEIPTGFTGTWSIIEGNANAIATDDLNEPTAKLAIADGKSVKVKWTIAPEANTNGCSASGIVTIENNAEVPDFDFEKVCNAEGETNLTAKYTAATTDIEKIAQWSVADGADGEFEGVTNTDRATYKNIPVNGAVNMTFTLITKVGGVSCKREASKIINNYYYEADAGQNGRTDCNAEGSYKLSAKALPEGATGTWIGGADLVFESSDPEKYAKGENDPNATVKGLSNVTSNVLTWKVTGHECPVADKTVTIINNYVPKPTIQTQSQTICEDNINLVGNKDVARNNVVYYWTETTDTWKSGDKSGYNEVSTCDNVNVTLTPNTSSNFQWNVRVTDQSECNKPSEKVAITNKYYEAKIVSPSTETLATCSATTTLEAEDSYANYGVHGHWECDNPDVKLVNAEGKEVAFDNPSDYSIKVTGLKPAATKFTWIVDDGYDENNPAPDGNMNCPAREKYVSISNISVEASATATVKCDHSVNLVASNPKSGKGHWEFVRGSILNDESLISGSTFDHEALNVTVTGLKGGNYTYKWVVTTNDVNCKAEKELFFTDNALDVYAQASAQVKNYEANVCEDSYSLAATEPKVTGATGVWTNTDGTAITDLSFTVGSSTDYSATVKGIAAGTSKTIRWTITNPDGCPYHDDITIANGKPIATVTVSPSVVCDGSVTLETSNDVTSENAVYTGTWSKGDAAYSGNFRTRYPPSCLLTMYSLLLTKTSASRRMSLSSGE